MGCQSHMGYSSGWSLWKCRGPGSTRECSIQKVERRFLCSLSRRERENAEMTVKGQPLPRHSGIVSTAALFPVLTNHTHTHPLQGHALTTHTTLPATLPPYSSHLDVAVSSCLPFQTVNFWKARAGYSCLFVSSVPNVGSV